MAISEAKREYNKQWAQKNKERIREYREKTKDKRNARRRELYTLDEERRIKQRAQTKEYRKKHPNYKRNSDLLQKFGITKEDYDKLLESQGGGCAICGRTKNIDSQFSLHVDHNHKTKKIRGILCSACNLGIGKFLENPDLLQKAADYLRRG